MRNKHGHRFPQTLGLVVEVIHTQEAKRRKGTSLTGWHTGQRMGRRTLGVKTSMLKEMVEAKVVRGICSRKWA